MKKKNIFIIRHGQTEHNRLNIVQGSKIDKELNQHGLKQADLFFEAYKSYPFQHIYVSALKRTYQSVEQFIKLGIPYTIVPELNEISWGEFEGKVQNQSQKSIYYEVVQAWNNGELHISTPGGESPEELQKRQKIALDKIITSSFNEILVCMHGRALKSFLCLMLNKSLTEMDTFKHSNLCLYQLKFENDSFELVSENDTTHLNGYQFL
ncbi:MAG: histidine phosphatase family protein [Bacteroidia bacterium]|nr:histidine phosphatase family protein [Bacteroidia bacterium]